MTPAAPRDDGAALAALPRLHFVPAAGASPSAPAAKKKEKDEEEEEEEKKKKRAAAAGGRNACPEAEQQQQQQQPRPPHHPLVRVTPPPGAGALRFAAVARHGPGLRNVGNSCYANATLQALLHNPAVLYVALTHVRAPHPRVVASAGAAAAAAHNQRHKYNNNNSGGGSTASAPPRSTSSFCALCALRDLARVIHPAAFVDLDRHHDPGHEDRTHLHHHRQHHHHHNNHHQHNSKGRRRSGGGAPPPPSPSHSRSQSTAVTPSVFVDPHNLRQISRSFQHSRQEDAHEFLRGLLDAAMRSALLGCGAPHPASGALPLSREQEARSVVHAACGGMLQSGVYCHACGHESITLEPFLDLSIGTAPTLERALDRFTASDKLDGNNMYHCESCRKKVVASKRFTIRTAPNSLTIHLKRFNGFRKDRSDVRYPITLNLAPYMMRSAGAPQSRVTGKRAPLYPPPVLYNLVGVLVHDGHGTRSGHYYSYVKGSNGTWCLKNDASSSVVPESRALRQQAYILFYSRDPDSAADLGPEIQKPDRNASKISPAEAGPVALPAPSIPITQVPSKPAHSTTMAFASIHPSTAAPFVPALKTEGARTGSGNVVGLPPLQDPAGSSNSSNTDSSTDPDSSTQDALTAPDLKHYQNNRRPSTQITRPTQGGREDGNPIVADRPGLLAAKVTPNLAHDEERRGIMKPESAPGGVRSGGHTSGSAMPQISVASIAAPAMRPLRPNEPSCPSPKTFAPKVGKKSDDVLAPEAALSPKRKRHQLVEAVPETRRFLSHAKSEEDLLDGAKSKSGWRDSDIPSDRGSVSLRSLQSGFSADNSEGSRDSGVRAFIAGSGRAVRKFAQRLLNYVGSSPENSRAGQADSRDVSSSSSSGVMPFEGDESTSRGVSAASPKLPRRRVDTPRTTASSPTKNRPTSDGSSHTVNAKQLPSTESHIRDGKAEQDKLCGEGVGGIVFHDLGIGGWETAMPESKVKSGQRPAVARDGARTMRAIPKRRRARDLADAEYDHGKPKKVKRARPGQDVPRGSTSAINPFQAAAERRKYHGVC